MPHPIHTGRWLQLRGRIRRAWGSFIGNDQQVAAGNADIAEGALRESLGVAKRDAVRGVNRGIDKLAAAAKKVTRSLKG